MKLFIIGDIHGCYYTFNKLVDKYWNGDDFLIQVGDLIDRGNYSPQTVEFCRLLQLKNSEKVCFIKGNHEIEIIRNMHHKNHNWLNQCGNKTIYQYYNGDYCICEDINWFTKMSSFWENDKIFVSHAGVSHMNINTYNELDLSSIFWTRQPLINSPIFDGIPKYNKASNTWYIDTGAAYGGKLTAIILTLDGELIDFKQIRTCRKDIGDNTLIRRIKNFVSFK